MGSSSFGSGSSTTKFGEFYDMPELSKEDQKQIIEEITQIGMDDMTPKKLVEQLDQFIISQEKAKKIVAQAIRNKYRQRLVEDVELRKSMRPSNILVSGKSGSGKTEIFRQISKIYNAPFITVEATKYTEVGYHGDDVNNIITDLYKKTQTELQNKEGVEIFGSSNTLRGIIYDHILKILLGPSYKESSDFEDK